MRPQQARDPPGKVTLVDALRGPRRSAGRQRGAIERGERVSVSTMVLYEWLRRPRLEAPGGALDAQPADFEDTPDLSLSRPP